MASLTIALALGTGGLAAWIKNNVIEIVLLIIGVAVLWAARSGNISKAVTIVGGAILGIAVLGMAGAGTADHVGHWIVHLFGA